MGHRFLRTTSLLATAALAATACSFPDWHAQSAQRGGRTNAAASPAEQCALADSEPVLASIPISPSPDPSVCMLSEAAALDATVPAPIAVASASLPAAATPQLVVVRARVADHGAVETIGHSVPTIDRRVLAIVARELAFPQKLKPGTPLEAVYEDRAGRARIVALNIGKGVAARHAFYFRSDADGAEGFFARDGKSLEHRFLRYPLAYDLVTSPFSAGRLHPVLASWRPHNGVDFGARIGTPVIAVGAGKVRSAGWEGRYGRTVTIEHEGGYVSRYSHLREYASSLRKGASVAKGQLIGYVGASGLVTGPHLHFSILKNGGYLDPLGRSLPKRASLDARVLGQFRNTVARVERAIAAAADVERAQVAAHTHTKGRDARSGG